MKFARETLAALGMTLFSATLLTTPASAEVESIPAPVEVSTHREVAATSVGALGSGCEDYFVCFWALSDYNGSKSQFSSAAEGGWVPASFWVRSAKNRFGDRAVVFGREPGVRDRCLNPGSSYPGPFPDSVDWVYVGLTGSRC